MNFKGWRHGGSFPLHCELMRLFPAQSHPILPSQKQALVTSETLAIDGQETFPINFIIGSDDHEGLGIHLMDNFS